MTEVITDIVIYDTTTDPQFVEVEIITAVAVGGSSGGGDNGGGDNGGGDNGGGGTIDGDLLCELVARADSLTVPDDLSAYVRSVFDGTRFISMPPPETPCDITSGNLEQLLHETQARLEHLTVNDDLSNFVLARFS